MRALGAAHPPIHPVPPIAFFGPRQTVRRCSAPRSSRSRPQRKRAYTRLSSRTSERGEYTLRAQVLGGDAVRSDATADIMVTGEDPE